MKLEDKITQLQSVECIRPLPQESIRKLASECDEMSLISGQTVFEDGDSGESMFIVLSGAVGVYKKNKKIATRGPGEFIGEMALMQSGPRSATAKAVSESCLLKIDKKDFFSYMGSNPQALFAVLKTLSDRSREDLDKLDQSYKKLQTQEKLSQSLNRVLESSSDEIYILDSRSFQFIQVNSRARSHLGYEMEQLQNMTPADIVPGLSKEDFKGIVNLLLEGMKDEHSIEGMHQRKDGSVYPVHIRLRPISSEGVSLIAAHVEDRTQQKEMEKRLENITYRDALTGLPNRTLFVECLEKAIVEAGEYHQEIAVLHLNIDNFKAVNDALGRETGDLVLKEVAAHMKSHFRREDLIGRLAGDEFLVLVKEVRGEEKTLQAAERFLESIREPIFVVGQQIRTTFCIGISRYPDHGISAQDLLMQAETALYAAKEKGKNICMQFDPAFLVQAAKYLEVERGLIRAMENDELVLHYQPTVDLGTGRVVGVEALVRWMDPEMGLVPPGDFIPVAEKSGLILPLGDWVLEAACKQFKLWQQAGIAPEYVAVNYSGVQFNSENPVPRVSEIIGKLGLDPRHLELEITETVLMQNSQDAIATLQQLSDLGIHLAIDDFGTGYSSLTYLSRLPVDTLKIDRSFVSQLHEKTSAVIARTIVSLGQALDMKTIAEGVETESQKQFLQSIGCDRMQGYLFSKPLPEADITRMLREGAKTSLQPQGA